MRGLNKVMLIGHLGADPEVRHLEQNQVVANFRLATNRSYTNKAGEKVEETEWHRVVSWGKLAEIIEQYVHKGSMVYVEGRLTTRQWQDKEGNERYTTEVRCESLQMLDRREDTMSAPTQVSSQQATTSPVSGPIQPPPPTSGPPIGPDPSQAATASQAPESSPADNPADDPSVKPGEQTDDLPF